VAISASTLRPLEAESVRFQASAADANMDPLTFHWDFGDGTSSEERNPTHTYADEGRFEVMLTVSDGRATASATLTLEVQNAAPVLVPLEAPAMAEEGRSLTLRAQTNVLSAKRGGAGGKAGPVPLGSLPASAGSLSRWCTRWTAPAR
jgi:hypothetical protein